MWYTLFHYNLLPVSHPQVTLIYVVATLQEEPLPWYKFLETDRR